MSVPWFIGQEGAKHPAEVARLLAFAATRGAEGVVGVNDMKVTALNIPGTAVQIRRGSVVLLNRSTNVVDESYVDKKLVTEQLEIAPTGSGGGRSDLVVYRVEDSQYSPWIAPADVANGPYGHYRVIPNVPAGTTHASQLGLNHSMYALARIDIPKSTATIENDMIKDLRKMANPRRDRAIQTFYPTGEVGTVMSKSGYANWPINGTIVNVEVPSWATVLDVVCHISGLEIYGSNVAQKQTAGVRTMFGGVLSTQNGIITGYPGTRPHATVVGRHSVSEAQRGTVQPLTVQGYQTVGTGRFESDYQTSVALDWEFTERPV